MSILEMFFGGVASSARIRERDRRIDAERQQSSVCRHTGRQAATTWRRAIGSEDTARRRQKA